ncbi:hypothetical protein Tco_0172425 [Tanacetum coccineum]
MTSSSKINSPNYKRKSARIRIKSPNYVNLESSSEEHHNERTPSPPPRKKSLSPPHASSKSTSSRSTYQTVSSSLSESPTPTHVAPPPKLRFFIPIKLKPQELLPQQTPPHNPHVSTMDNWPPDLGWALEGNSLNDYSLSDLGMFKDDYQSDSLMLHRTFDLQEY